MSPARYPARDQVAIVGVGRSPYSRDRQGCTPGSLVIDATIAALRDCGLGAGDVDGICGSMVAAQYVQAALGIPAVTWFANPPAVIGNQIVAAVAAIASGVCDTALVYHHAYRLPWASAAAAKDPFRRRSTVGMADSRSFWGTGHVDNGAGSMFGAVPYAAWAGRYLHDYGYGRDRLGLVAINSRTNAVSNPDAVYREPLTMEDYLDGRMVREPLCVYDMDVPIDGADAFVLTTAERARDLPHPSVLVHAATLGHTDYGSEEQLRDLDHAGQVVVARRLWEISELGRDDMDLLYPYEGFSNIMLCWLENLGFCGRGEAGDFMVEHWDDAQQRLLVNGRVPVNSHGGSLSEGGTQGSGAVREAVRQLRGTLAERQVHGARAALVTPGGFYFNSQGMILRRD
ncbi:MAG: thiolase family protein [Acidimicrobiia bacterium]|nr:thiolase family protein [Acidimicrobiia bacterium]